MTSHWFDGTKRQTVDAGIRREKDERVASHIDCISRIVIFGSDRHPSICLATSKFPPNFSNFILELEYA